MSIYRVFKLAPASLLAPTPAVNHASADVLPLTSYTNVMGHEEPPHVAIVSVHFISLHVPLLMRSCAEGP